MGRLGVCTNGKGKEGLLGQSCLHAVPNHFLRRPTLRGHLYLEPEHFTRVKSGDQPHHGLGAPPRMITIRSFLFVAFSWMTSLCASLAAEEIKYRSPDGRFALRITQPKDDEYHPTIELIEKYSS